LFTNYTHLPLQTVDEVEFEETEEIVIAERPGSMVPERYLINMGESIKSVRQLLRRACFINTLGYVTSDTANFLSYYRHRHGRYPPAYGYDSTGPNSAAGTTVPGSNFPFTYVATSFYGWLAPMYIGQRGSATWTYQLDNGADKKVADIRAYRAVFPATHTSSNWSVILNVAATPTTSGVARAYVSNVDPGSSGQSVTNQITQAGISVNYPFYSRFLFYYTNPLYSFAGVATEESSSDTCGITAILKPVYDGVNANALTMSRHFNVGPDFTFYFFLCVPSYRSIGLPAAN